MSCERTSNVSESSYMSVTPYTEDELVEGSKEVKPVEEVITRIKYVEV